MHAFASGRGWAAGPARQLVVLALAGLALATRSLLRRAPHRPG
ncbi:hypothetical protein [Patulibacter sp. SYSU D01012]|nr:hypothetical protein [Patulibacter sp. SYSU D01012]